MAGTVPKIVPARVDLHTCTDVFRGYRRACGFRGKILKLLNLGGKSGRPGGNRTPDQRFRKPLLYPSELQAHNLE